MIMNETGFFRLLWRFNAIGIAVALVIAIALSLFAAFMIVKDITTRNVTAVINVESDEKDTSTKQFYTLGDPAGISGHNIVYMHLYFAQKYEQSYFSKNSSSNVVNYVFFDFNSKETTWLFDHNNFLILQMRELSTGSWDKKNKVTDAFIYALIKDDTNKDGRLTSSDIVTVSIYNPAEKSYAELLPSIKKLMGIAQPSQSEIALTFEDDAGVHIAVISLDTHQILYKTDIPFGEAKEAE